MVIEMLSDVTELEMMYSKLANIFLSGENMAIEAILKVVSVYSHE